MRISLLTDGIFPYVIGGMQKHSYYLAKYLAKSGIEVDLYHTNQSKFDINKLELFTTEEKKHIHSIIVPFPKPGRLPGHYIKASYNYSKALALELKKRPVTDFIYAKGFTAWRLLEEKHKGWQGPPIGINFHGYEMFQKFPDWKSRLSAMLLLRKPVLKNIKNADYLFSYGGKITNILQQLGIPESKIIEIPTGIEENWLYTAPLTVNSPRKFVFVGRYERRKGIEELSKVLMNFLDTLGVEFHFVGPIPDDKKIRNEKIVYHGPINDAEKLKQILRQCDVLVCPSHSEGMPNVIVEAMASGLAIIATDVGAVSKMVSSTNGRLIDVANLDQLSKAMLEMASIPSNQLVQMKKRSTQLVENEFLWSKIVEQTINAMNAKIN